jgi:hypothetical protein
LETLKSDTWIKLAEAYRDLLPIKNILFELSNRYNKIPYAFPVTVAISGLKILSDAIVYRAKWNNPNVLHKRNIMLNDNQQTTQKYITEWRRNTILKTIKAFQIIKRAKRNAFEKKSYFNLIDIYKKGNVPAITTNNLTPDDEKEKNNGDLDFAKIGQSYQ